MCNLPHTAQSAEKFIEYKFYMLRSSFSAFEKYSTRSGALNSLEFSAGI